MVYRKEIDGLRAIAVLPVILFHSGISLFSGGYVGVDIFFVISGFLITSIILNDFSKNSFSLIEFYERRSRRILPLLFFIMAISLPFAWFFLLPHDLEGFSKSLIAVSLFSSNFLFWKSNDYFDTSAELKPLLHTWSLGVEEQYYIFFPLIFIFLWKYGLRKIYFLLFISFISSLLFSEFSTINSKMFSFYLLPTRAWELLIGSFSAILLFENKLNIKEKKISSSLSIFGFILIITSIFTFDQATHHPGLITLIPVIGTALVLIFSSSHNLIGKFLSTNFLVVIGLMSYSAYLWHQPIISFVKHAYIEKFSLLESLLIVCVTLLLSYFSWKYIENPFRNKSVFSRKSIFIISLIGSILFIIIGIIGVKNKGFVNRFKYESVYEGDVGHLDFHKFIYQNYYKCTPDIVAAEALSWESYLRCMQSKDTSDVSVALIGDSHAEHLFIGLSENLTKENVVFYIKNDLPIISNKEFKNIFDTVINSKSIHTVIFSMHWVDRFKHIPKNLNLEYELIETFEKIMLSGKKLIVVDDVPRFPFPAERCKFKAIGHSKTTCEVSVERIIEPKRPHFKLLKSINYELNFELIDLRILFCSKDICSMTKDNTILYRDNNHLNIPGSEYVGKYLINQSKFLKMLK